jgi:hypothetical protein
VSNAVEKAISRGRGNILVIVVAVVLLGVLLVYFWGRQQKRDLVMKRLDIQEHFLGGPSQQNAQPGDAPAGGGAGRIL